MSLLTEEYIVSVDVDCEQNENGVLLMLRLSYCMPNLYAAVFNTNGWNDKNNSIKIPLSFKNVFILFWPSNLLKEKVTTVYY